MLSSLCRPRRTCRSFRPQLERLEDRIVPSHAPLGPEFQVNQDALLNFGVPDQAVASDAAGNFVVVWVNEKASGTPSVPGESPPPLGESPPPPVESPGPADLDPGTLLFQVHARLFNRDGVPRGGDILVADALLGVGAGEFFSPVSVDVAMTPTGDFVVVHDAGIAGSDSTVVKAHYFSASGADRGEVTVAPSGDPPFNQVFKPSVARDSAGNVFVAFQARQGFGPRRVFVQVLDSSGARAGGPVLASDASEALSRPAIAADGAGRFVVVWNANVISGPGEEAHVVFRRFAATGTPLDAAPVDVSIAQFGSTPSVGRASATGVFVVAWDINNDGQGLLQAQRFDASGSPLGAVVNLNEDKDIARTPHVAVASAGAFAASWVTDSGEVRARAFRADGIPESAELVAGEHGFVFTAPDIAVDGPLDQFVVSWPAFEPVGTVFLAARIFRKPAVASPPNTPRPLPPSLPVDTAIRIALVQAVQRPADPFTLFQPPRPEPVQRQLPVRFPEPKAAPSLTLLSASEDRADRKRGEVSGLVFDDANGDGVREEGEAGLAGQRVFLDLNCNGLLDDDEPVMDTNEDGRYLFSGLALDRYHVRQVRRPARVVQTAPEHNAPRVVELTDDHSSVPDQDFGAKMLRAVTPVSAPAEPRPEPESDAPPP